MEAPNGEHYLGDSRAFVHESCEADTEEPRTDSDADSETELKQKVHKVHSPEQEEYEAFDPEDRGVLDPVSEDPLVEEEELSENAQTPKQQEEEDESEELELGDRGEFDPGCEASGADWEVSELRHRARSLKQELEQCKAELSKLQKRLSQSERVQRNTESYNQDLRKQVEQLSAELHERKKREKDKSDAETQTEEYTWTEEDYYNYYYGGYYQDAAAEGAGAERAAQGTPLPSGVQPEEGGLADDKPVTVETTESAEGDAAESAEGDATAPPIDAGGDAKATETTATQEVDGSISDMLRSTAEEAMCQTGFVFDENTGMYYDHSTGFYYDSVNQLYYDNNTGIYYYYDAESGKYEFHSRVELQSDTSTTERSYSEWKSWKLKKLMSELKSEIKNKPKDDKDKAKKDPKEDLRTSHKKPQEQRKPRAKSRSRSRSRSRSPGRKRRNSPKLRGDERRKYRDESPYEDRDRSRSRSRSRSRTRSRDKSRSRRRRREERRRRRRRRREETRSDGSDVNSEPEEGELSESERETTPSSRGSEERGDEDRGKERGRRGRGGRRGDEERGKDRGRRDRGGRRGDEELGEEEALEEMEMELELDAAQGAWPPCVRVTVVRSPVLQVGTLFILTADATATIGREKDMDHAIRISEMGVSKFHAEVFFDLELQCYMIVDQGSQNGTVINGNRILQPKQKSAPHPLSHGDEVRMGDTVLSFHIHRGTDTCDGCEPGQILAHLSKHPRPQPGGAVISSSSREDKEALRVKELKNLKAKYGIQSNEESSALRNSRYRDRAESRRQTVGSEGAFQRDDAPASVHQEISEGNKGRKMLEKMGWKKGEGLGKEGSGIRDPIELKIRKAQSGLGAAAAVAVDDASLNKTKNQKNWDKARERFAETYTGRSAPPAGEEGGTAAWVRGPTEGAPQS